MILNVFTFSSVLPDRSEHFCRKISWRKSGCWRKSCLVLLHHRFGMCVDFRHFYTVSYIGSSRGRIIRTHVFVFHFFAIFVFLTCTTHYMCARNERNLYNYNERLAGYNRNTTVSVANQSISKFFLYLVSEKGINFQFKTYKQGTNSCKLIYMLFFLWFSWFCLAFFINFSIAMADSWIFAECF